MKLIRESNDIPLQKNEMGQMGYFLTRPYSGSKYSKACKTHLKDI